MEIRVDESKKECRVNEWNLKENERRAGLEMLNVTKWFGP